MAGYQTGRSGAMHFSLAPARRKRGRHHRRGMLCAVSKRTDTGHRSVINTTRESHGSALSLVPCSLSSLALPVPVSVSVCVSASVSVSVSVSVSCLSLPLCLPPSRELSLHLRPSFHPSVRPALHLSLAHFLSSDSLTSGSFFSSTWARRSFPLSGGTHVAVKLCAPAAAAAPASCALHRLETRLVGGGGLAHELPSDMDVNGRLASAVSGTNTSCGMLACTASTDVHARRNAIRESGGRLRPRPQSSPASWTASRHAASARWRTHECVRGYISSVPSPDVCTKVSPRTRSCTIHSRCGTSRLPNLHWMRFRAIAGRRELGKESKI